MEKFWKAALGVAGIGAVGMFVLWSLYKDWLKLPYFVPINQDQTFQLFRYFLFLTFGAGALCIGAYVYVHGRRDSASGGRYVPQRKAELRLPDGSRFTDAQFDAYEDVWVSLQDLNDAGEALWDAASKPNLERFANCLKDTRRKAASAGIFFQQADYTELQSLLQHFISFYDGKQDLFEFLEENPQVIVPDGPPLDSFVVEQIKANKKHMTRYTNLLKKLRTTYHDRLAPKTNVA
ncbi:MAG: hypothetical protein JO295_05720 [Verrucomicrobia bacterium]|nr:hypothetical protein [Verrucomicrobiota bacterium]